MPVGTTGGGVGRGCAEPCPPTACSLRRSARLLRLPLKGGVIEFYWKPCAGLQSLPPGGGVGETRAPARSRTGGGNGIGELGRIGDPAPSRAGGGASLRGSYQAPVGLSDDPPAKAAARTYSNATAGLPAPTPAGWIVPRREPWPCSLVPYRHWRPNPHGNDRLVDPGGLPGVDRLHGGLVCAPPEQHRGLFPGRALRPLVGGRFLLFRLLHQHRDLSGLPGPGVRGRLDPPPLPPDLSRHRRSGRLLGDSLLPAAGPHERL